MLLLLLTNVVVLLANIETALLFIDAPLPNTFSVALLRNVAKANEAFFGLSSSTHLAVFQSLLQWDQGRIVRTDINR